VEQVTEAIILAGGLGTRLRSAVPDLPKCMAPVAGKPFLHHVIAYLQGQGINRFIFSLGYMHEVITSYIHQNHPLLDAVFSIEDEPLGTGGAIKLACIKAVTTHILVMNGDTLFNIAIPIQTALHINKNAACTLALKPMKDFDRYGIVMLDADKRISHFAEKKFYESGLINGGVYLLQVPLFLQEDLPKKFSFEKDYLEKLYAQRSMYGVAQNAYFIDIGIPGDFEKANRELGSHTVVDKQAIDIKSIDKSWTLFLDRDGVINYEKHLDYIHVWDEFVFYEGVKEAMKTFHETFGYIVVVTNQKGVGKGVTKLEDLQQIHQNMVADIEATGGRIDKVYFCADLDEDSPNRKPNPGMGLQAKKDFEAINFSKTIMIGNTMSDMEFGRNLGAKNIFLPTTRPETDAHDSRIDMVCSNLQTFAIMLKNNM
jgi:D-glycero-alpha-D-manno-heptose 1-phosphate guanylyltransferase